MELACRTSVAEQQTAAAHRDASDLQRAGGGGGGGSAAGQAGMSGEALLRFIRDRLKAKEAATAQCKLRSATLQVLLPAGSNGTKKLFETSSSVDYRHVPVLRVTCIHSAILFGV